MVIRSDCLKCPEEVTSYGLVTWSTCETEPRGQHPILAKFKWMLNGTKAIYWSNLCTAFLFKYYYLTSLRFCSHCVCNKQMIRWIFSFSWVVQRKMTFCIDRTMKKKTENLNHLGLNSMNQSEELKYVVNLSVKGRFFLCVWESMLDTLAMYLLLQTTTWRDLWYCRSKRHMSISISVGSIYFKR